MTDQLSGAEVREPVTVLGLGPMGRALASAFLAKGHQTTVWNRSPGRAEPLVARGATHADTVADAVAAGPLTIVCLIDYDAVGAVLHAAAEVLKGRTVANLTSDSPDRAREMSAWATERGVDYLDGSIMTPAQTIGEPAAVVLYSGPEPVFRAHQATLASLGGTAVHLGADPGRAAAHDVALLDVFWTAMSGIVHAFALAQAENIAARELAPFAQGISGLLSSIISEFADHIDNGHHPGDTSTILSAAAGMKHIIHAARSRGIDTSVLDAAEGIARRAIGAGHGADGFSRLAETLRATEPAG